MERDLLGPRMHESKSLRSALCTRQECTRWLVIYPNWWAKHVELVTLVAPISNEKRYGYKQHRLEMDNPLVIRVTWC